MKFYKIRITEIAERDIEQIGDYIAYNLHNPMGAQKVILEIKERISTLHIYPKVGNPVEDEILKEKKVRKILYNRYRIYYIVDDNNRTIYIISVLHELIDANAVLHRRLENYMN